MAIKIRRAQLTLYVRRSAAIEEAESFTSFMKAKQAVLASQKA
jgi:hypothetical protein